MAACKTAAAASMTGVGGRSGITLANSVRHSACVDGTDKTASASHKEFAVPSGCRRKPDLGFDFRIGLRPQRDGNSTVSCGLYGGGYVGQASHVRTRSLGEQWDGQQDKHAHAHSLLRSAEASHGRACKTEE